MLRRTPPWTSQPSLSSAPSALHDWLTAPESLTARIVARCEHFRVRVVGEAHVLPNLDEYAWLGLRAGRCAWVRDVLLLADDIPVVFAHSVVALSALRGSWHIAQAIGNRPLGAALFADPLIARSDIACARISAGHPLHRRAEIALGIDLPALWGRRSRFLRHGQPLGVSEVFLPGITKLPDPRT